MTSENVTGAEFVEVAEPGSAKVVDDQLVDELVSRAQARACSWRVRVGCSSS